MHLHILKKMANKRTVFLKDFLVLHDQTSLLLVIVSSPVGQSVNVMCTFHTQRIMEIRNGILNH